MVPTDAKRKRIQVSAYTAHGWRVWLQLIMIEMEYFSHLESITDNSTTVSGASSVYRLFLLGSRWMLPEGRPIWRETAISVSSIHHVTWWINKILKVHAAGGVECNP